MATPPKRGTPGSADNLEAMLGALKSVEKNVSFVREKLQTLVGRYADTTLASYFLLDPVTVQIMDDLSAKTEPETEKFTADEKNKIEAAYNELSEMLDQCPPPPGKGKEGGKGEQP